MNVYQIKITNETELFNPLDPTHSRLNDNIYSYIQTLNAEQTEEERKDATVQIFCGGPVDIDRIQTAITQAVSRDLEKCDKVIHDKNRLMIWMYIVGIGLSILGIALSIIADEVLLSIISFFGSLAVREAVSISIHTKPELKEKRKLLEHLSHIRVDITQQ